MPDSSTQPGLHQGGEQAAHSSHADSQVSAKSNCQKQMQPVQEKIAGPKHQRNSKKKSRRGLCAGDKWKKTAKQHGAYDHSSKSGKEKPGQLGKNPFHSAGSGQKILKMSGPHFLIGGDLTDDRNDKGIGNRMDLCKSRQLVAVTATGNPGINQHQ